MALTEDVASEVRRILTHNTVDQCILYNQTIKRDIAAAQEELRDVIGQRYRDLLQACDRVVGMNDICAAIESSYQKSAEIFQQRRRSQYTACNAAANAENVTSTPEGTAAAEARCEALLVDECEDLLRSVRTLLRQEHFTEAAKSFLQLVRSLDSLRDSGAGMPSALRHSSSTGVSAYIIRAYVAQFAAHAEARMVSSITALVASSDSNGDTSRSILLTMHAAIELIHSCSPTTALETLIGLHMSAISNITSSGVGNERCVEIAQQVRQAVLLLAGYLTHAASMHQAGGAVVTAGPGAGMSLEELSRLDKTAPGYAEVLKLHLCGLRGSNCRRIGGKPSAGPADGWALSPAAGSPIKIPLEAFRRVVRHALAAIETLLSRDVTCAGVAQRIEKVLLAPFPPDVLALVDNAAWEQSVQHSTSMALRRTIEVALQEAETRLKSLFSVASVAVNETSSSSSSRVVRADDGTDFLSIVLAASKASGTRLDSASPQFRNRTALSRAAGLSEQSRSLLQDVRGAIANVKNTLQIAVARGAGSPNDGTTSLVLDAVSRMASELDSHLQDSSSTIAQSVTYAVSTACDALLDALDAQHYASDDAASLFKRLERLYVNAHTAWLDEVVAAFRGSVLPVYHGLCALRADSQAVVAALCNARQSQELEGATHVHYPVSFTPGIGRCVFEAQQAWNRHVSEYDCALRSCLKHEFYTRLFTTHVGLVSQALSSPVVASASPTTDDPGCVSEELCFHLYFDVTLLGLLCNGQRAGGHPSHEAKELLSLLESHIDVVNWSVTRPLLLDAASCAASHMAYTIGCATAASVQNRGASATAVHAAPLVVLEPESDRLPLLPITAPSQIRNVMSTLQTMGATAGSDAAEKQAAGGAQQGAASNAASQAIWSATSKLRSVAALWGQ